MAALPFSSEISQSSSGKVDFKVLVNKYGNGYEQRIADGINNNLQTWEVSWEGLGSTDFSTLVQAIEGSRGVSNFTWTPPGAASTKKFVVVSYSISSSSGAIYTVSASLRQVADVA